MKRRINLGALASSVGTLVLLTGCLNSGSENTATDQKTRPFVAQIQAHLADDDSLPENSSPLVVNGNGQPVIGAQVLLGDRPGVPFANNVVTTDSRGRIPVPAGWRGPLKVSVQAGGLVRGTFLDVAPSNVRLEMSEVDGSDNIEIKGTTTDFGTLPRDGKVDFGLVIPALTRRQMIQFDVAMVLSPEVDRVNVGLASFDVPSNVTLPEQRETYIVPITLNKPDYRLYLRRPGSYRISATHGQFPLKRVADDLRAGKSFFDVINFFEFKGGGQIQVQANRSLAGQNIRVNGAQFNSEITAVGAPLGANQVMLALALNERDGFMVPTDIKRTEPHQRLNLKANASGSTYQLSILTLKDDKNITDLEQSPGHYVIHPAQLENGPIAHNTPKGDHLSFAFERANRGRAPAFLELIAKARVDGNSLVVGKPRAVSEVRPLATYAILSEIEKIKKGELTIEKRTRLWEITAAQWLDRLELPDPTWTRRNDRTYRWEVLYLGRDTVAPANSNALSSEELSSLELVTHATRSAMEF